MSSSDLRPSIFIASSSEAKSVAKALEKKLEKKFNVITWYNNVFKSGEYTLESLRREVIKSHFAIFIFHPDDKIEIRGETKRTVRDNVLFEMGLFLTHLGRKACFTVVLEDSSKLRIASDLFGLTNLRYKKFEDDPKKLSNKITHRINELMHGGGTSSYLTGNWTQIWQVESSSYPNENKSKASLIEIDGRLHSEWESEGRTYALSGEREGQYITGLWFDLEMGGTYHGSFQLKVHPKLNKMDGKWIGYSSNGPIKSGDWNWIRE